VGFRGMEKNVVGLIFDRILQISALVLFLIGSIIVLGSIVVGYDPNYGVIYTTYLSYGGIVRNVLFTLIGAMLMSSVLILRNAYGKFSDSLFLGLVVVNLYRLVSIPPNWGVWGSGFSPDMLVQFEFCTIISIFVFILAQIFYIRFISSETVPRGIVWIVSIIAILGWITVLVLSVYEILFSSHLSFGLGWSGAILFGGFFMQYPIAITIILVLMNSVSKIGDSKKKNEGAFCSLNTA
jgi:hypothetical protein